MKTSVTLPREIQVAGFKATINIKFVTYDEGKRYYCSVSETAKAVKAIAKAAGFNVLRCKSHSYSGGDSVDIYVESGLTQEQRDINRECFYTHHSRYTKEPNHDLIDIICDAFEQGSFNGMEDIYEYRKDNLKVEAPNGEMIDLDTKYCFSHFEMK